MNCSGFMQVCFRFWSEPCPVPPIPGSSAEMMRLFFMLTGGFFISWDSSTILSERSKLAWRSGITGYYRFRWLKWVSYFIADLSVFTDCITYDYLGSDRNIIFHIRESAGGV